MNEKHIEECFEHKKVLVTTVKCPLGYRKHRYELVHEPRQQPNTIFIHKEWATKVVMGCRTTAIHKFRTRLGFKKQSVLVEIKSSFERENMQTQNSVLHYRIELYSRD